MTRSIYGRMDGAERRRQVEGNKNNNNNNRKTKKKETCDVGGMMVVSAAIGETGITGIMGEEGGVASAC